MPDHDEHARSLGFRAWSGHAAKMDAPHVHGDVEVNFSPTGTYRYMLGGVTVSIPPGRLGVFWATVPHRLMAIGPDEATCYWVTIPLHVVLGWSLPDRFVRDLLAGKMLLDRTTTVIDEPVLLQWSDDLSPRREHASRQTAMLEVQARLRRMAIDHGWDSPTSRRRSTPAHTTHTDDLAQRMARFIADRYIDPIGVPDVARHVDLHPNYAMTLFRAKMGMSLIDYLTRQRVAHAQRLLVTTTRSVLDIGFDAGFGSVSRYYAAFKAITGRSPKSYRTAIGFG